MCVVCRTEEGEQRSVTDMERGLQAATVMIQKAVNGNAAGVVLRIGN